MRVPIFTAQRIVTRPKFDVRDVYSFEPIPYSAELDPFGHVAATISGSGSTPTFEILTPPGSRVGMRYLGPPCIIIPGYLGTFTAEQAFLESQPIDAREREIRIKLLTGTIP